MAGVGDDDDDHSTVSLELPSAKSVVLVGIKSDLNG